MSDCFAVCCVVCAELCAGFCYDLSSVSKSIRHALACRRICKSFTGNSVAEYCCSRRTLSDAGDDDETHSAPDEQTNLIPQPDRNREMKIDDPARERTR